MDRRVSIACVYQTGGVYDARYVRKLREGVLRCTKRPVDFLCLTDSSEKFEGWQVNPTNSTCLSGWWAKMLLFSPGWRLPGKTVYLDLDTVVLGDLGPLLDVEEDFAICENFQQRNGRVCAYGSCAMVLNHHFGTQVFREFWKNANYYMSGLGRQHGDQWAIEQILRDAPLLQRLLPAGFFVHKSKLVPAGPPPGAALAVFGGSHKPHNSPLPWVAQRW